MKTTIYYFSGTGNSLKIAKDLQREIKNTDLIPISSVIDDKIEILSDRIGIIFPVYMWGIPRIIKKFIKKIKSDKYVFSVITYSLLMDSTLKQVQKLLKLNGTKLSSGFDIQMPENAITLTNPYTIKKQNKLFEKEKDKITEIADFIKNSRENKLKPNFFLLNWIFSGILYRIITPRLKSLDKSFWVDDKCDICGTCKRICPVNNIEINNKIKWLHDCEQCLACIQWCPKEAIQYGKKTIKRKRYKHPEIRINDMIKR